MFRRGLIALLPALAFLAAPALARDLADIRRDGVLTIGTSGTAAPYSSVDDHNRLVGYDIDLGNAIGRAVGLPVRWKKIDFRGLLPALSSGQLDMVMSAVRIRPRLKNVFLFSDPYSYEETVAITRVGDNAVRSLRDIRGRSVAVVASSFQEDVTKGVGGYRDLLSLPNGTDVFLAMHSGHASVGVVGITAAEHYRKVGADPIRIVRAGAPLAAQGIVMEKDATALKQAVDAILRRRRADGSYAALYLKHFGMRPQR